MNNDFRFLHIAKTAGQTFTSILKWKYRDKTHFHFMGSANIDNSRLLEKINIDDKRDFLFTGHAPITTGIERVDKATTVTFLREPVSRVKSFCQYVSEGKSRYLLKDFPPNEFNLDRFLESGNEELNNLQTKMLVNHVSCTSSESTDRYTKKELKEIAIDNLTNRISCFGLQEFFDESLIIFSDFFDWEMPVYSYRNKKNSSKLLEFNEQHIEKIIELNSVDMEIYEAARKKFIQSLESPSFDKEKLEKLRSLVTVFSPSVNFLRRAKNFPLPKK